MQDASKNKTLLPEHMALVDQVCANEQAAGEQPIRIYAEGSKVRDLWHCAVLVYVADIVM